MLNKTYFSAPNFKYDKNHINSRYETMECIIFEKPLWTIPVILWGLYFILLDGLTHSMVSWLA